jgi:hypothetical protein
MTTDMRRQLPETIDDLREMNYTIVLMNTMAKEYHQYNDEMINGRER